MNDEYSRKLSAVRLFIAMVAWLAAAGGVLRLADIPGEFGGSLCGVWGCYPPFQALAAMHLFWCVVMVPLVWALSRWYPERLIVAGVVMVMVAAIATVALVAWDLNSWLSSWPSDFHPHWPKRAVYTVITLSDVPLLQTLIAGVACIILGRRKRVRIAEESPRRDPGDGDASAQKQSQ